MRRWLGLKPEGSLEAEVAPVDMLGPVSMRFRPILPTDEQANAMIAMQLVNAPKQLLSLETALERYLQLDDPMGEIDRIEVERALADPEIGQQVALQALKRAGIIPKGPPPGQPILGPNGQPLPPSGGPGQPGGGPPGMAGPQGPTVPGLNEPVPGVMAGNMARQAAPGATSMAEHHGAGVMPHGITMPARAGSFPGRPGNQR